MNRHHNEHHEFYASMGAARDEFRQAAIPVEAD